MISSPNRLLNPNLDMDPSDPFGLDTDENGIACDEPGAQVASDRDGAGEAQSPLDARLGSTLESWEAEFGPPVEREGDTADLFTEYNIPDLGTVYADEYLGLIESMNLFAPRPEGEEWTDDPHEMNWSVAEAHEIAKDFLPRDARLDETLVEDAYGFIQTMCTSDALAEEVPQEIYDYVDDTPQYGRCNYILWYANFEHEDQISWISIQLEIEEPPDSEGIGADAGTGDEALIVEVPQVDSVEGEPQAGLSAAEQAYTRDIGSILTSMVGSLDRAGPMFENPQYGNADWTTALAFELVIWQQSYQAAAALEPPPSMADIHALTVEALGLYSEAADHIATGIDSFDPALLNQAAGEMLRGGELINQANDLLNEFRRERGV